MTRTISSRVGVISSRWQALRGFTSSAPPLEPAAVYRARRTNFDGPQKASTRKWPRTDRNEPGRPTWSGRGGTRTGRERGKEESSRKPHPQSLPRHASSVQRNIRDGQVKLSQGLQKIAEQMESAARSARVEAEAEAEAERDGSSPSSSDHRAILVRAAREADELVTAASTAHQRSVVIFNQRIRIALLAGRRNEAFKLYNSMKKFAIAPTAYTFSIIFNGTSRLALDQKLVMGHDRILTEQISSLAHDMLALQVLASKFWIPPGRRHLSSADRDAAEREFDELTQLSEYSSAALSVATPAVKMSASRAQAAAELATNSASLSRAYADYLRLLSRAAVGRPAVVWQAYEVLRRGLGRPEGITAFEFARPYRSKAIFTTMLWTIFHQVTDREARILTSQAVQRSQSAKSQDEGRDASASDRASDAENGTDEQDTGGLTYETFDIPSDIAIPSTPFGQARQLWLDWEETIADAARQRLSRSEWAELRVDAKAYDMFVDFFSKCRTEEERAFAEHVRASEISQRLEAAPKPAIQARVGMQTKKPFDRRLSEKSPGYGSTRPRRPSSTPYERRRF